MDKFIRQVIVMLIIITITFFTIHGVYYYFYLRGG